MVRVGRYRMLRVGFMVVCTLCRRRCHTLIAVIAAGTADSCMLHVVTSVLITVIAVVVQVNGPVSCDATGSSRQNCWSGRMQTHIGRAACRQWQLTVAHLLSPPLG